jgi:shikimate dehydrogenase/3-dehydroquinate dehydratase type I
MTLIVASLVERSISGVSSSAKVAFKQGADLVEVRLDHLGKVDTSRLVDVKNAIAEPTIATLRSWSEGGLSNMSEQDRNYLIREILTFGFEYVDLELTTDKAIIEEVKWMSGKPQLIASRHFQKPASMSEVESSLAEACSLADVGKVAMRCEHEGHALMLADIGLRFSQAGERFILIGMGPHGVLTRICAHELGSAFAYACLKGKEAAPGQLDIPTQKGFLEKPMTVLGLLGHPVSHSVSQPMHEAALRRARLAGEYLPLDVPESLFGRRTIEVLRDLRFKGVNVTIPHKQSALDLCDELTSSARMTGAVNTISFDGLKIVGENTDLFGFSKLIEGKIRFRKKTEALVIGAGGAARAAVHVLKLKGAAVTVAARRLPQAQEVAERFKVKATSLEALRSSEARYDVVVNCTPLGMKGMPARNPVPLNSIRRGTVLFDIVYNPTITPAMKAAKRRRVKAYGGLEMLVQQGAKSFRIWTGKKPEISVMREAARRALK